METMIQDGDYDTRWRLWYKIKILMQDGDSNMETPIQK